MSEQPTSAPERPARYDRSFGGLIAAMIATVVFVVGFVGFRAFFREQPDVDAQPVDYLASVSELQDAGTTVVYPTQLPAGWIATSVAFERGDPPQWRVGALTDGDSFVGVVQQQADVADLLASYVDTDPDQGPDASPTNDLGVSTWQTWSDSGGDHAFSAELTSGPLSGQTVLVYGSAPVEQLEAFLSLLTTSPVVSSGGSES